MLYNVLELLQCLYLFFNDSYLSLAISKSKSIRHFSLWSIINLFLKDGWLVVGLKPIVRLWDLGLQGECPPWGVFLRDPISYLHEFQRKPRKTPNCQVDNSDWGLNMVPPICLCFELRTASSLLGQTQYDGCN